MDARLGGDHLDEGWRALEGARWDAARTAFEAALAAEETPGALDGLRLAVWFLGDAKARRQRYGPIPPWGGASSS